MTNMLCLHEESSVVIIGPPGSGKTTVGGLLAENSGLPLYSTDEFLCNGEVQALYKIMQAVGDVGFILEGMIGYRWLRKRKQLKLPAPDIVIELDATDEQITQAYKKRNSKVSLQKIKTFCKGHRKVLDDYLLLDGDMPKVWLHADCYQAAFLINGMLETEDE